MALAQLNFHLKMVFASTGTCSLTLHYPCSVTSQSASALEMSRIKNVMIMPLRCKNVSPRPWKSLVHCRDTSIREKHVYPKSLELERVVSILGHPTIASAAKRESLWPVFTPDTDFFFPKSPAGKSEIGIRHPDSASYAFIIWPLFPLFCLCQFYIVLVSMIFMLLSISLLQIKSIEITTSLKK